MKRTFLMLALSVVACGASDDGETPATSGAGSAGAAQGGKASGGGSAGAGGAKAGAGAGGQTAGQSGASGVAGTAGTSGSAGKSGAGGNGGGNAAGASGAGGNGGGNAAGASGAGGNGGGNAAGASGAGGNGGAGTAGAGGNAVAGAGGVGGGSGAGGKGGVACGALPPPSGAVTTVTPAQASQLASIVKAAAAGDTVLLASGTYDVAGQLVAMSKPGVTVRGADGDATKVILDQHHQGGGELFLVGASSVTIADLTIRNARNHAIHFAPMNGADTSGGLVHRVTIEDPGQQGIKGNSDGKGHWVHETTVACSRITLGEAGRADVLTINGGECYTGGIDVHGGRSWVVRDTHIEGFWCHGGPSYPSEHGIHFWNGARDTVIERCTIDNCARAIGLGLGDGTWGTPRTWPDDPCPDAPSGRVIQHYGGVVRNTTIHADDPALFASTFGFDVGVDLQSACGATVVHTTVVSTQAPKSNASIHCRYPTTTATITNNLTSHPVRMQCAAASTSSSNLTSATAAMFVAPAQHDLHLLPSAAAAIDQGAGLAPGLCDDDLDGQPRVGPRDLGADER